MPICPECPSEVVYKGRTKGGVSIFWCDNCQKHFYDLSGTEFDSKNKDWWE